MKGRTAWAALAGALLLIAAPGARTQGEKGQGKGKKATGAEAGQSPAPEAKKKADVVAEPAKVEAETPAEPGGVASQPGIEDEPGSKTSGKTGGKVGKGKGEKAAKAQEEAKWKTLAAALSLGKKGITSNILNGKIPPEVLKEAGGSERPKYLKWPLPGGRFGRGFGSGKEGRHKALDIIAPQGTPVLAASYGLVVWAEERDGFGETVLVLHPGGWVTLYAHLSKYLVKAGMKVKTHQKIALVGDTGISKGAHLHFMLFDNGVLRDPAPLFWPSYPHPPHVAPMPFMGHTVKKGETPTKIAGIYGVDVEDLFAANGMKKGEEFKEGWRITIPKKIGSKTFEKGVYTVKKGDSLAVIAQLYDVSVKKLKALNGLTGDKITLGMKLEIPEHIYEGKLASGGGGEEEGAEPEPGTVKYPVQAGDNLALIAKKLGTTVAKIIALNDIKDPNKIKPGMTLIGPEKIEKGKPGKKGKGGKKGKAGKPPATGVYPATGEKAFAPVGEEDLHEEPLEEGGAEGEGTSPQASPG